MLSGSKSWAIKKVHENKLSMVEVWMLRWMHGRTKDDRLRNVYFRWVVGAVQIKDKVMKNQLRWYGYVERRSKVA